MGIERRQIERFRPKESTFVAFRPEFSKMGKLLDISKGGLCFQYMARGNQVQDAGALEIDMFLSSNGYYLPNVPCKLVYDAEFKEGGALPDGMECRRCGLRFENLTKEHTTQLELYLKSHTAGTA